MVLIASLPIRLGRALNAREHWAARARRTKQERALATTILNCRDDGAFRRAPAKGLRVRVLLVRVAPRPLDDDNVRGALKAIRDGVADFLGVADDSPKVAWGYKQERGAAREYGVRIELRR